MLDVDSALSTLLDLQPSKEIFNPLQFMLIHFLMIHALQRQPFLVETF